MTMSDKPVGLKIVKGPGKFDLMFALFERKEVVFKLESGSKVKVLITSVQQEDGSSNSWNISGFIVGHNGKNFDAYYRTGPGETGWFIV